MKTLRVAATTVAIFLTAATSQAATIGNALIDRAAVDGISNFLVATDISAAVDGTVTSWGVYAQQAADPGESEVALAVLTDLGGQDFEVTALDFRTITQDGVSTFTSSLAIAAGQRLGLYMNRAKVVFDASASGASTHSTTTDDFFLRSITLNQTVTADVDAGNRTYSLNATVTPAMSAVPLPASLPMALVGLGALAWLRRRKA